MSVTFYFQPPALLPGTNLSKANRERRGGGEGGPEPDKMNVYVFYRGKGWLVTVCGEKRMMMMWGKKMRGKKRKDREENRGEPFM